jgi:hypothetical protein
MMQRQVDLPRYRTYVREVSVNGQNIHLHISTFSSIAAIFHLTIPTLRPKKKSKNHMCYYFRLCRLFAQCIKVSDIVFEQSYMAIYIEKSKTDVNRDGN